ncbi:hypothetical protein [Sphingomonas sp. TZW2008]|uniref:hypothetical protein n=1 Tax=Sphingomonas sp. TZW2008 TaxID=1917973 RepID=UPI000A268C5F|nr:hypothetical protein [Sphingomonas sp. TZW2008]
MRFLINTVSLIATALAPITATAQMQPAAADAATAVAAPLDAKAAEKAAKLAAKIEAKKQSELRAKYGDGPYPDQISAYADAKPDAVRALYRALYVGGERNAVLNFERLGLAAFEAGLYKEAAWAFDQALSRIETVYADNKQAATARSIFHNEANKDFKGEPYERAMAYYYRGLIYLRDGDYGNARASFKSAEYQDTLSETESFQSDFAVMNYLVGWTQRCEGQNAAAAESFALATKAEKNLTAPPEGDNVLFLAELGNGPVKARDGSQAQKLLFQAGADYPENAANVAFADGANVNTIKLFQASSVTYQATTRGGRAIDGIMDGKANWKEGTEQAGDAAMLMGQQRMLSNPDGGGGMGMMGLGLAMSLFSSAMKTKADIRAWDGLPDLIMVGTTKAGQVGWTYTPSYLKADAPVDLKGKGTRADPKGCSIVWMRSRPVAYSEAIAGEDEGVAASQNRKKAVQEKNKAFRTQLESAGL